MTVPSESRLSRDAEAASKGRRGYIDDVVRALWPYSDAGAPGEPYVMVPSGQNPAALVPRRPRRAAASAIRNHKSSAGRRDQVKFGILAAAARLGAADLLPSRRTLREGTGPDESIAAYLRHVLDREVVVSLYASAPRANRKPVLQLLSGDGRGFGFAKVGLSSLASNLVRAETRALEQLGLADFDGLVVPRVLHQGEWRGHPVLVQQTVGDGSGSGAASDVQRPMSELARKFGSQTHPVAGSPYVVALRSRLTSLPESPSAHVLQKSLAALTLTGRDDAVELGAWHGDWTPWNMTMKSGRALVWDWERFELGVPVGFDAIHYRLQQSIVRERRPARDAAAQVVDLAGALLARWGLSADRARIVALLYLIEIGYRYEFDGQAAAGAALGDLSRWLLPVLVSRTGT